MSLSPLGKDIAIALAVKLAALVVLFVLFFAPGDRPEVNPDLTARHLTG